MSTLRMIGLLGLLGASACLVQSAPDPTFPTAPAASDMNEVQGPPGGAMDPDADQAEYPAADSGGYAAQTDPDGQLEPSADPQDPGYVIGDVNDAEIDATLDASGTWQEVDGYGRVWRPDPTVVGSDFTPYETSGTWVDTDYGWSFGSDFDWGWLPYHYGRWGWFDDFWGWVPGYSWGPAWCEWRHGGGYVGWRPLAPTIRDHRHPEHNHDANWRFTAVSDFGKRNTHAHLFQNPAEGLRVTTAVARPPVRGTLVSAASVMHNRLAVHTRLGTNNSRAMGSPGHASRANPARDDRPTWQNHRPSYQPPARYQPPPRAYQSYQPSRSYQSYQPPARSYQPPARSYQPPARTYQPPARTYQPPTRSYQPPTRSSFSGGSPSSGSFHPSAPSRSSGSFSSGSSHSSGSSSHSSGGGGGGRHR